MAQGQAAETGSWTTRPYHRNWLMSQADALFDFYQFSALNPGGGFFDIDASGRPFGTVRQLHSTTRMIHCFAIGSLLGRPGADEIVDHGMRYLWNRHRDRQYGGYLWSLDDNGPHDTTKQAYGHAFVLLAASSAKVAGHPLADVVLADISEVLDKRFWEERHGAVAEEFAQDWSPISAYRGQNSNMHLTEALMAAFEATGESLYLDRAERIADLVIGKHAAGLGYRVAEHFDADWTLDKDYRGSDMFRPAGTTPGHWLEWSRLLLQLWVLGKSGSTGCPWRRTICSGARSNSAGTTTKAGSSTRWTGTTDRPCARSCGGRPAKPSGPPRSSRRIRPDPYYEEWYRRIWGFCANRLIDHQSGGWHHELSEDLSPIEHFFTGKPDIYHALQACLIPLYPATGSLTRVIPAATAAT